MTIRSSKRISRPSLRAVDGQAPDGAADAGTKDGAKQVDIAIYDGHHDSRTDMDRAAIPQTEFNEIFQLNRPPKKGLKKSLGKRCNSMCCEWSTKRIWSFLKRRVPVLDWVPRYDVKENLVPDLLGGLTVGVMHIPQGMAYAMLANIPPVVGLYVSFFCVLVYFVFGTSRQLSVGTFAVITLMTGQVVNQHVSTFYTGPSHSGNSTLFNFTTESPHGLSADEAKFDKYDWTKIQIATSLCMVVGIFQLIFAILQLGTLAVYLSDNLVSGFTTASAVHVFTSQIPALLGISISSHDGVLKIVYDWIDIFKQIQITNLVTLGLSAVAITSLVLVNDCINLRYRSKMIMPVPMELIVIIAFTVASYFGNLHGVYKVKIVNNIPTGIPYPAVPRLDIASTVIVNALPIAIVSYCIPISLAKIFAKRHKYEIDPTQEMFAYSACNIIGCFFLNFPCCGSLSRSTVQELSGAKTQLCSSVSAVLLLIVLLWIGPLFEPIPNCILSSIIVVALRGMLRLVSDFKKAWETSFSEAAVWAVTFVAVIILDVSLGLFVGLGFSILVILFHAHRPYVALLGRVSGSETFLDIKKFQTAKEIDGIKIVYFGGSLYFGNREFFRGSLYRLTGMNPQALLAKMKKYKAMKNTPLTISISQPPLAANTERSPDLDNNTVYPASNGTNGTNGTTNQESKNGFGKSIVIPIRGLILDCSAMGFADMSGLTTLNGVLQEYNEIGVKVFLASCQDHVLERFEKSDFYSKFQKCIFPTVSDALAHVDQDPTPPSSTKL